MAKFKASLDRAFSSDAAKEGAAQVATGVADAKAAAGNAAQGMRDMILAVEQRAMMARVPEGATGAAAALPGAPPPALQKMVTDLRGVASALVGSAASTRGNVTKAVTETELKKQTVLLEDINTELKLQNDRGGNVFRR